MDVERRLIIMRRVMGVVGLSLIHIWTYGRRYRPAISLIVQGAGSRPFMYGDGQRQGDFVPVSYTHLDVYKRQIYMR